MENLVPIGRFSKMSRLSVKALRHYDEVGLLSPAWVDPSSGYRYYSFGQAAHAEVVRTLRSLDMPLDEIARVLSLADRPAEVKAILDEHRRRLEIDLARQQRMLEFLERLMTRESIMPYEVTVKNVDPLLALATRKKSTTATVAADVQDAFGSLMQVIMSGAVQVVGAPFIVFLEIVDDTGGEMEVCVPVAASADVANGLYMTEIPGGMVASTIHQGPYAEVGPAHHVVAGWIQEHGHQPAGPPREVYLNDPTQVSEDEQLTEVIWPITD